MPDGDLFRRTPEEIIDGDKTIHEGDENEKEIINDLQSLLEEMNGHYLPSIEKCFIAQYIHPFYDGNGRTGRFIPQLRKIKITTISLLWKCLMFIIMEMQPFLSHV